MNDIYCHLHDVINLMMSFTLKLFMSSKMHNFIQHLKALIESSRMVGFSMIYDLPVNLNSISFLGDY